MIRSKMFPYQSQAFARFRALLLVAGVSVCACPASATSCVVCGRAEPPAQTEPMHHCLSLCLGSRRNQPPELNYNGVLLGLVHASLSADDVFRAFSPEQCQIRGLSTQLLAQVNVGTISGATLTGIFADVTTVKGAQISGLANRADDVSGAQVALALNRAEEVHGVQIGLINISDSLHGIQIGLINITQSGWWIPLLHFSTSTSK